jgi:Tfp pilus assembly protein PilX
METQLKYQRGVALPIALIMFVVMLVGSVYLMRSSTNATIMAGNLANERAISRSVDFGLSAAYLWLSGQASSTATKPGLDNDQLANGYLSTYNTALSYRDVAYWNGSTTVAAPSGETVEYVIHRMCMFAGAYNSVLPNNSCVQSVVTAGISGSGARAGDSLASDASDYDSLPQIHYVITARVRGLKGASVVNQIVVMIGA